MDLSHRARELVASIRKIMASNVNLGCSSPGTQWAQGDGNWEANAEFIEKLKARKRMSEPREWTLCGTAGLMSRGEPEDIVYLVEAKLKPNEECKVIEKLAYDALKAENENYRIILLKLADSVEQYADSGLIDNYTVSELNSPSLSDVLDEARAGLDGESK